MKHIAAMFALLLLTLTLSGCGQSEFHTSRDVSTGEITIHAENSTNGTDNGLITLEEGECLVFSPSVSQGSIHITVTQEFSTDSIVFEADITGNTYRSEEMAPGNYQVFINTREGATGSLHIFAIKEEDLEQQMKDREEEKTEG